MENQGGNETAPAIVYLLLSVGVVGLFQHHGRKYRSDLFTETRDSVKYLRAKSVKMTQDYRLMQNVRILAIFAFSLSILLATISHNFWPASTSCRFISVLTLILWQTGKASMYITYILAIYSNYKDFAKCAYPTNYLLLISTFVIVGASVVATGLSVSTHYSSDERRNNMGSYPYYCFVFIDNEEMKAVFGLGVILWDFVLSLGSILAFRSRLKKLDENYGGEDNKNYKKAQYVGRKYAIIVTVAATMTICWIVLALFGLPQAIITILGGIDFFVSIVCLMLLAPYYPSDKYFATACYPCVKCCGVDYVSKSSESARSPDDESVETREGMGQILAAKSGQHDSPAQADSEKVEMGSATAVDQGN